jgi:methylated-DNA-protein-cysteine methyltransferase-like protein
MQPFTKEVINIIRSIPRGRIMTYGQIANMAGSPRAARQVARILHSMSKKHGLPWHRVVNSSGQAAIKNEETYEEQIFLLNKEGVITDNTGRTDLARYQWSP